MADVYGVVPEDISGELKTLFPEGFGETTTPTRNLVKSWISAADLHAQMQVRGVASGAPSQTDAASQLARSYVIDRVTARVLRAAYLGNTPQDVAALAGPYAQSAKDTLADLIALGERATGTIDESPDPKFYSDNVGQVMPTRDLIIQDEDLDFRQGRF